MEMRIKNLQLSNSQINTYKDCPYKWYLQKVKRLRPTWTKSSFLFGSAIDATVETMLKNVGKPESEHEDYWDTFFEAMDISEIKVNNTTYKDEEALLRIQFAAGDIQLDTLDEPALEALEASEEELEAFVDKCKAKRKKKKALDRDEQIKYNSIAYQSLICKASYLLPALDTWIKENVAEVHAIQQKIEIENAEGDKLIGYLDFIVTLKDGRKILIDLKTTSSIAQYYPQGCVEDSRQLAIYAFKCGLDLAGYLVIDKYIRKREPRIRLELIEGEITEEQLDRVFDEIADVVMDIKEEKFEKNENSCYNYGGCEYKNFCHKGKKNGLEIV